jgi:hypothetical protein
MHKKQQKNQTWYEDEWFAWPSSMTIVKNQCSLFITSFLQLQPENILHNYMG